MIFLDHLLNGLSLGSIYAIIALGYTMVYGIAKMLNFAHGDVIMVGAYIAFCGMQYWGFPPVAAILAAMGEGTGLDEARTYRFTNVPRPVDVKRFGTLVNTIAPIHIKQDSLVHDVVARVVKMQGETEDVTASGALLMHAGVKLAPAFAATGYDERVRFYPDFFSRLYFIEAQD